MINSEIVRHILKEVWFFFSLAPSSHVCHTAPCKGHPNGISVNNLFIYSKNKEREINRKGVHMRAVQKSFSKECIPYARRRSILNKLNPFNFAKEKKILLYKLIKVFQFFFLFQFSLIFFKGCLNNGNETMKIYVRDKNPTANDWRHAASNWMRRKKKKISYCR